MKASPAEVWDALTNPEKTKKYFFHCKVYSDWQPGSDIVFKGRIFLIKKIELRGKIIEAEPGKILQYRLQNRNSKNTNSSSLVTDELVYANGQTTLTVSDDVGQTEGAEKRFRMSEKGWDKVLKGLKKLVEGG